MSKLERAASKYWWSRLGDQQISQAAAARIRAEQLSTILRQTPNMMAANICNALVLLAAFWSTNQRAPVMLWTLVVTTAAGLIYFRHMNHDGGPKAAPAKSCAIHRAVLNALMLSMCWAAVPAFFFQGASSGTQLLITCLCAGMLGGGAFALASIPIAAVAFTTPIFIASAATLARNGGWDYFLIATVLGVYTMVLLRGVFTYAEQIRARTLEQLETEQRVRTDALTSLPNRLWFQEAVDIEFARIARSRKNFALMYVDLDDFKLVNDRWGHAAGDDLLIQVARRMRACLRPTDLVARLGGDEFAVLASTISSAEDAHVIARRLTECFQEPFLVDSTELFCRASLGVAIAPKDGDNPHTLLRNADIALYRAKQNGGLFCLFDPRHEAVAREERALEFDLRRALQLRQFRLAFQPLLNIESNEINGCEALLRWIHPTRGMVEPSVFIPLAERTGFIHDIGLWVIEQACQAAADFPGNVRIAVNVSAVQLRDSKFAEKLLTRLRATGVSASQLEIEITESALLSEDPVTDSSIRKLAGAGVAISLDDFGTGYCSLSYLRKLPIHKIKIDRSFTKDVLKHADCAAIVRGVIRMATDLNIISVGEGVEEVAQLEWLRENGCSQAQGYLLSKPLFEAEFKDFIGVWTPEHLAA